MTPNQTMIQNALSSTGPLGVILLLLLLELGNQGDALSSIEASLSIMESICSSADHSATPNETAANSD